MPTKVFKNLLFDTDTKTFTITKGSVGTYSYMDITKCSVLYEDSKFSGKTSMFSHQSIGGRGVNSFNSGAKVYAGIRFVMKNEEMLYVYISDAPNLINTFDFFDDQKEAQKIKEYVQKIIKKYA